MTPRRPVVVVVATLAVCGLALGPSARPTAALPPDPSAAATGLFTAEQDARGSALYTRHCAACHGSNLEGKSATPLAGAHFVANWANGKHTLDDLYFITKTTMPHGAPGSLGDQQYVDILAHVLAVNGYPPGPEALPADPAVLARTRITPRLSAGDKLGGAVTVALGASPTGGGGGGRPTSDRPTQAELNAAQANTADWLLPNHDYGGQRFVDLRQINRRNVASLHPVAMYQTGETTAFHNNPIVYQGVMYVATLNSTMAIDATTGRQRWRFDREPKAKVGWWMNRGVALKDGKVIRGTIDGYLLALDAKTGALLWERPLVDMQKNEAGFTMSPVVFEDLVIIGPAGSENGVKGWVGAFKLEDGSPVWRFNTVPEAGEPGAETWGNADARLMGGGSVWTPLSLDVEKGLVYVPVANPAPDLYGDVRPGKNLYTSSMVVLEARTGKLQWFYQAVPHDLHDWDLTQTSPLFEARVGGKMRKLVVVAGKDGLLHVLDRQTHEPLYEVPVTTRLNGEVPLTVEGVRACPGILGGVQWNGPAFNPGTNMLYVNAVDWCGLFKKAAELRQVEGHGYLGGEVISDPVEQSRGWLTAIDATTGAVRWRYQSPRPLLAAVTTTSADLVFTGELTGDFMALDARTGEVLYRFNTGAPLNGGIVTYVVGGKQYVAVASGSASGFWQAAPGASTIILFALPDDRH